MRPDRSSPLATSRAVAIVRYSDCQARGDCPPLAKNHESPLAEPTFDNAISGKYPLGRTLTINVLKKPGEPLPPLVAEFIEFVLCWQGQEVVVKDGFGPLPPAVIDKELARLR